MELVISVSFLFLLSTPLFLLLTLLLPIGSHTVVELLNKDYKVVVVDNLCNASYEAIRRIEKITGKKVHFLQCDILDAAGLRKIFTQFSVSSVIHFAGLKAVGESTQIPLDYYHNNITGTITLLQVMKEFNVKNIVFSSSATVYGEPKIIPIPETCPTVSMISNLVEASGFMA